MSHTLQVPAVRVPANEEAEHALLGAILVNNRAYEKVGDFLRPEHFYDPVHGRIYAAIGALIDARQLANPVTLKRMFDADQSLPEGGAYLAELAAACVTVINAVEYGRIIRDLFVKRQLMEVACDMLSSAATDDLEDPADRQIERAEQSLYELGEKRDGNANIVTAAAAIPETLGRLERAWKSGGVITGVTTGLLDLDRITGGLKPGQLIILAARPAMGKTALAISTMAKRAAEFGVPVGVFSAEMTRDELMGRWIAAETGIPTQDQDRGAFDQRGWLAISAAAERLSRLPVVIDDSDTLTPARLRQRIMRMKRQHKIGLVVVDHLQRMSGDRQHRSDYEERSAVVKAVKSAAKAAGLPVLLLCQLSRAVEQREDKRPQLSDLRESGRIEEEADVVMALYRDAYYAAKEEPQNTGNAAAYREKLTQWEQRMQAAEGVAEIIILKQRGGRTGTVRAHFDGARTLFSDLAE